MDGIFRSLVTTWHGEARRGRARHGKARNKRRRLLMEGEITMVRADRLVRDFNLYPRTRVSSTNVWSIKNAMEAGRAMPPLVADKTTLRIVDGFHRLEAHLQLKGGTAEISVQLLELNEAAFFEMALELNCKHGDNLTTYDRVRSVGLGESVGLHRDAIASALHITRDRLDCLCTERRTIDGVAMKQPLVAMVGPNANPTASQLEWNRKAGGMRPLFYINQVLGMLEHDWIDWEAEPVRDALQILYERIGENMKAWMDSQGSTLVR
jgi:hypothetical protein